MATNEFITITIFVIEGWMGIQSSLRHYEEYMYMKVMVRNGVNYGRFWLAIYVVC